MHVEKMYVEFKCMFKYVCLCWITSMLKKVHVVIKYVQKKCMLICVMFNYLYVEFCYVELFACWIQVCWKMCRSNPLCRSNQTPPTKTHRTRETLIPMQSLLMTEMSLWPLTMHMLLFNFVPFLGLFSFLAFFIPMILYTFFISNSWG